MKDNFEKELDKCLMVDKYVGREVYRNVKNTPNSILEEIKESREDKVLKHNLYAYFMSIFTSLFDKGSIILKRKENNGKE